MLELGRGGVAWLISMRLELLRERGIWLGGRVAEWPMLHQSIWLYLVPTPSRVGERVGGEVHDVEQSIVSQIRQHGSRVHE